MKSIWILLTLLGLLTTGCATMGGALQGLSDGLSRTSQQPTAAADPICYADAPDAFGQQQIHCF